MSAHLASPVWPDVEIKVAQIIPKVAQKSPQQFLLNCYVCQNSPKRLYTYIWISFARKFVAEKFQKSLNLVTLGLSPKKLFFSIVNENNFFASTKSSNLRKEKRSQFSVLKPALIVQKFPLCLLRKKRWKIFEPNTWMARLGAADTEAFGLIFQLIIAEKIYACGQCYR